MNYFTNNTQIYYIDPSKSVAGNGNSVEDADNSLPSVFSDNTIYLIRRTNYSWTGSANSGNFIDVSLKTYDTSDCAFCAIIGMPKQEDDIYNLFPEEVKSAWGSDSSDYAILIDDSTGSRVNRFSFSNCHVFKMFRIKFMQNRSYGESGEWSFSFPGRTDVYVEKCWFKNKRYELSDIADNTPFNDNYYCNYNGCNYMTISNSSNWSNIISFKNTIVENTSYNRNAIFIGNARNVVFDGVDAYGVLSYNNYHIFTASDTGYNLRYQNYSYNKRDVLIKNCNHYIVFSDYNDTTYRFYTKIFYDDPYVNKLIVDGFNSSVVENPHRKYYGCRYNAALQFYVFGCCGEIKNVFINFPYVRGLSSSFIYIVLNNTSKITVPKGQYFKVSDLTLLASPETTCNYNGIVSNINESFTNNVNPFYNNGGGLLILNSYSLDVEHSRPIDNNYRNTSHSPCNSYVVDGSNININAYTGIAARFENCYLDMENTNVIGAVLARSCVGKINKISSWFCYNIFYDDCYNLLYINELEGKKNNQSFSYNGYPAINKSYRSFIYCNRSNIKAFNLDCTTDNYNYLQNCKCFYCCANSVQEKNFIAGSTNSFAQSWSINRNGGSNSSIKLSNECGYNPGNPLVIGSDVYKGFVCNVPAGSSVAKFYMTTFGYNIPIDIMKHLFVELHLPDGNIVYSSGIGYWEEDNTSVWDGGINDNYSFTLSVPIESGVAGSMNMVFMFDFYQIDCATYLDPYPEIINNGD